MSYTRQPLLSKQQEVELKTKMEPLWNQGLKGKAIAKELKFGQPNTEFAVLKPSYVYFYRLKFGFSLRAEPRFKRTKTQNAAYTKDGFELSKYRCKKPFEELKLMPVEMFEATLNKMLPRKEENEHIVLLQQTALNQVCFMKYGKL